MSDSTTNLTVKEGREPSGTRLLPHPDSHNIIFFSGMDNQEVMRITPDGRLVKGPGLSDDTASLLFFDSCKKVFGNAADELRDLRAARAEADDLRRYLNEEISTNSELGDELLAERATFAEFRNHAWEQQRVLRAEVEKLKGELSGIRTAVIEACRNAQMKVLVWYPENTRNYIHPNQLAEIYKSQVTECLAAIERVFGESGRQ